MVLCPSEWEPSHIQAPRQAWGRHHFGAGQQGRAEMGVGKYNAPSRPSDEVVMKRTYMCLFVDDGGEGGIAVFAPDIPSCASAGDNMEDAREMIRECMDLCLEDVLEDSGTVPEPKMSTLAEATEWFRELMNYELDGETEEDRAFNEDDLHVEMIKVEVNLAKPATR